MKKIAIILFLLSILFTACNKEEDNLNFDLNLDTIEGKWVINSPTSYNFIEFTKDGKFFISHKYANNPNYLKNYSNYEIINGYEIEIENLGKLSISSLTQSRIYFILDLNRNTPVSLNAIKVAKISQSEKTKLISKTWEIESINGLKNEIGFFIFSDYGTFYQQRFSSGFKFGKWKWCNTEETKITISTDKTSLDCNNKQIIENIILTDDTFSGNDKRNGQPEFLIMKKE